MSDNPIATESIDDGVRVKLHGEIDLSVSPQIRQQLLALLKDKPGRLVVDLSDVQYMDSSGVATLVEALQKQRRNKGKMVLYGLQPKVRGIFEVSRLDMVFEIVDDLDEALKA